MLKHNSGRVTASVLSLAVALFFTFTVFSCNSVPKADPVDSINLVDNKASFLIYIPCTANQEFVQYAMVKIGGMAVDTSKTIAGRTENIAVSTDSQGIFQVAFEGSYPSFGVKNALKEKKGWKSKLSTETTLPVKYYYSDIFNLEAASPDSRIFMASQNVTPMLKRYENEQHRLILAAEGIQDNIGGEPLSEDVYKFLKDNHSTEIRFFCQEPSNFINSIAGKVVSLGIDNISGILVQSKADKTFGLTLNLQLSSGAVTKAAVKLLKLALFPIPAIIVQTDATHIQVTDISLTYNQLIDIITKSKSQQ